MKRNDGLLVVSNPVDKFVDVSSRDTSKKYDPIQFNL